MNIRKTQKLLTAGEALSLVCGLCRQRNRFNLRAGVLDLDWTDGSCATRKSLIFCHDQIFFPCAAATRTLCFLHDYHPCRVVCTPRAVDRHENTEIPSHFVRRSKLSINTINNRGSGMYAQRCTRSRLPVRMVHTSHGRRFCLLRLACTLLSS